VKDLVQDYIAECRVKGILQVRIIHGKGIGTLREMVHSVLSRMPEVESYKLADEQADGWGATIVILRPRT
jgi:dsDNA-specific endonuclease/ATPase MutS2